MTSLLNTHNLSIDGKGFYKAITFSILEAVPTGTAKQRKSHVIKNFEYENVHKPY